MVAGKGGDEQREPAGDGCFECMDAAAERWPHEAWGQTAARIAGSADEKRRLVAMAAVRAGRQKPDFLPTSVKMRTSLTARWVDTRVPVDVDVLERTPGLRDPRQAGLAIITYKNGVGETKEAVMVSDPQYPPRLELSTEVSSERVELTLDGAQQIEDSQAREIVDALRNKLLRDRPEAVAVNKGGQLTKEQLFESLRKTGGTAESPSGLEAHWASSEGGAPAPTSRPESEPRPEFVSAVTHNKALAARLAPAMSPQLGPQAAGAAGESHGARGRQVRKRGADEAVRTSPPAASPPEGQRKHPRRKTAGDGSKPVQQLPSLALFVLGKGGMGDKSAKQVLYHYKLHLDSQERAMEAHEFQKRQKEWKRAVMGANLAPDVIKTLPDEEFRVSYAGVCSGAGVADLPVEFWANILRRALRPAEMDPEEAAKALSVERECGVEAKSAEAARENGPPKSISDIPLAWVKAEDRQALCEQLFTQGFMTDFAGLREASSPHFRALRKVLLPQLESGAAASSAEVGAPTPASIVRDYILLFSSPFQTDPLTKEQMQLIVEASSPGRAAATHIKLMHELLDDAWWQKQMKPVKKFSVTETTHAPKITQVLGGLASGSSEEAAEAWATLMADSGWRAWWPGMREPLADRLISAMIEQARGQVAGEAEAQHVREAASRLSWLLSALAGKGAANAEKQVAALINEARGATREADKAAHLRAAVQKCSEFVATPSQEGLAALAGCFSQCEGLALEMLEGKQVLDAVASILASGEFARDDALGAAEAMLGVVPDDARARDCSAGALRAGVAAARAAANVIADSDSSIPELCELLAKIDERVSACAQQVEGLMPWWSDLQREVAEKKEQIRRAAQQKIDALAAGLRGKLREVREAMQRDGTEKGWKEFLPESHSWQDVVHAMELTFWVPTRDRSSPAAQSVGRIARLDARYTSAKKEWGELESAALEIGVAVPNDTKAEYDETIRKALVAAAEEYFVRTLEEGGEGAGTAVMKRQAYIVKKDMFDYEAEILPMIKTRVQRAISDEA